MNNPYTDAIDCLANYIETTKALWDDPERYPHLGPRLLESLAVLRSFHSVRTAIEPISRSLH